MLKKIQITNFKTFESESIEFGQVNMFIGGNGAGKSNTLEAIGILSSALGAGISNVELSRRGIRLSAPEIMKSANKNTRLPRTFDIHAFFNDEIEYKVGLTSRETNSLLRFSSESCLINHNKQFGRSGAGLTVLGQRYEGNKLDGQTGIWNSTQAISNYPKKLGETFGPFSRFSIFTPQTDFLRGMEAGKVHEQPIGLHGEGLAEAILDLRRQWYNLLRSGTERSTELAAYIWECLELHKLPGWSNKVHVGFLRSSLLPSEMVSPNNKTLYFEDKFMNPKRGKITAYDSSEGTLFLNFFSVLLAHKQAPRYFAIDNIDNALNPKLTRSLIERIIKCTKKINEEGYDFGPKQIFMTSHNPTSLDAFDLFNSDQRVFTVKRDDLGFTRIIRLIPPKNMSKHEWVLASGGKKLSQMWIDGDIDGINGGERI